MGVYVVLGFSRGEDGSAIFSAQKPSEYFRWSEHSKRVHDELGAAERWRAGISQECLPRGFATSQVLEGKAASIYVDRVRAAFIARGQHLFSRYTSAEWLWLIRNVDAVAVCSAIPYLGVRSEIQLFRVAENLIAFSTLSIARIGMTTAPEEHALWVARLMSLSACIDHLENLTRRIAKGQHIRVNRKSPPSAVPDAAFEKRIKSYDDRHSSRVERWFPNDALDALGTGAPLLAAFKMWGGWHKCDGWRGPLMDNAKQSLNGQFKARAWDFTLSGNVDRVVGSLLAISNPEIAVALLLLARACFKLIESVDLRAGEVIPRYGVLVVGHNEIRHALAEVLTEAATSGSWDAFRASLPVDKEELERNIRSLSEPGRRSAYGSLIHDLTNDDVLIDLNALTWRLGQDLRLSGGLGGTVIKKVADNFELSVQAVVDAAGLAPSDSTTALRGRQLKLNGQYVTDLDAMLVDGNTLVIISCKRIELGTAYDAGVHARVRAGEDRVKKAIDEWSEKTEIIRANRVGGNYDLSSFDDIVGIVITPELVYSSDPRSEEMVVLPNLRLHRLTTIDELADTLEGRTNDAVAFRAWLARQA